VLTTASIVPSFAQENKQHRPTVGLALEGGGALGLAHVGLLEWLAQHHIPVDYIAGASMGGLVAGFYASGMTPDEMHKTVAGLDWQELVNGESDDRNFSYRRKQDVRTFGNESFIGLRHGLIVPTGLNSGQGLNLLLGRVALPYGEMKTFDDLPTPYRTVATDIVKAKSFVFEKGSLAEAMRATMSIPALFDPVIDNGHEFVDGGLLNNLPVDLVKKMGADIVIAVYLKTDPFNPNAPQSAFDVLGRSLSAVIAANERHNIEAADLLVTIDCSGFTAGSFSSYETLMKRGVEGAEKKKGVLSKFEIDEAAWKEFSSERATKRKTTVGIPRFIEIRGVSGQLAENIQSYFVDELDKPFDARAVETQISRIMGSNVFAYMFYRVIEKDGKTGIRIYVHPSPSRPPMLQPAFLVDGSDYRNTRFTAAARLTALDFGGFRSELRTDFVVGSTYAVRSEYFHPFTPLSRWFIAPQAYAETRPLDIYRKNELLSLYRQRNAGGGVDLGYSFGNYAELRVGYQTSRMSSVFRLGDSTNYPLVDGRYGAAHIRYTYDRLDDEIVPSHGLLGTVGMRWVEANPGANRMFPVLEGSGAYFHPLPGKGTLMVSLEGGTIFGSTNTGLPLFFLGGPQRLSAYGMNELYGNQYVLARVGYLKQIAVLSPLTNSRAYFVANYEVGRVFDFANSTRAPMDVNAGLLVRTLLGPVFVGASTGDDGHRKWYFQIGRFF
jgi:NTE family protein